MRLPYAKADELIEWTWISPLISMMINHVPTNQHVDRQAGIHRFRAIHRQEVQFTPMPGGHQKEGLSHLDRTCGCSLLLPEICHLLRQEVQRGKRNGFLHNIPCSTLAFLHSAQSGEPFIDDGPSDDEVDGAAEARDHANADAAELHTLLHLTWSEKHSWVWPASLSHILPSLPPSYGARRHSNSRDPRMRLSQWDKVSLIPDQAPQSFYADESQKKCFISPSKPADVDAGFACLPLPPRRSLVNLKKAICSFFDLFDTFDQLDSVAQCITMRARDVNAGDHEKLVDRGSALRQYLERCATEGRAIDAHTIQLSVRYKRIGRFGRRYAVGPSLKHLRREDRSVAIAGRSNVVDFDVQTALFALSRTGSTVCGRM